MFEFYRKDMASRLLIMARSAMPKNMKRTVLTQEAIRILRNSSADLPWDRLTDLLSDFCLRMKMSGYNEHYRHNIIISALAGWNRQKENDRRGIKPMYRDKNWNKIERIKSKEKKAAHWFRKGGETDYDFPIFCPCTPDSKLLNRWRKVAEEAKKSSKGRVKAKIVEQGGIPLKSLLCTSAPKEDDTCGKTDCKVCGSETTKSSDCKKISKGGIGYEIKCKTCENDSKVSLYHGETTRTLYTRAKEHFDPEEDTPVTKHSMAFHPGEDPNFDVRITGRFKDPLTRQINEGVRINNSKSNPGYLMNSKAEFRQGVVPRAAVITGLGSQQ